MNNFKNEKKLKYNFVFCGVLYDYLRAFVGEELCHNECVRIYKEFFQGSKLQEKLFHYHWAFNINKKVNLPLKSLWFNKMYPRDFKNDLPLCYIYLGGGLRLLYDRGFTEYVRRQNPANRQIILHEDLIDKDGNLDWRMLHSKVDLVMTYDEIEAKKYGIYWQPQDYYSKLIQEPAKPNFIWDAYLVAAAKKRLPQIMAVYHHLTKNNIKCRFLIAGVPKEQQQPYSSIEYISSISYEDNLKNVLQSKCIVELIQEGTRVTTLRTKEAIAYRRRLLSNCPTLESNMFNAGQLQQFSNPANIDCEFIKAPMDTAEYSQRIDLNPINRLYDIQDKLEHLGK